MCNRSCYLLVHFILAFQDIIIKFMSLASTRIYVTYSGFFLLRVWQGHANASKKENFFLIIFNEVLKSCEK